MSVAGLKNCFEITQLCFVESLPEIGVLLLLSCLRECLSGKCFHGLEVASKGGTDLCFGSGVGWGDVSSGRVNGLELFALVSATIESVEKELFDFGVDLERS